MLFKNSVFNFGGVKEGDKISFSFEVADGINTPIQHINWGCGCTKGLKVDSSGISGEIDISAAGYFNGNDIRKAITVCFDDGREEWIAKEGSLLKEITLNKEKMRAVLTLQGYRADIDKT